MYIISGEVDVAIGTQTVCLTAGDIYLIDSKVLHNTKSIHGNNAILIQLPYPLLKKYIPNIDNMNFAFDCHTKDSIQRTKILKLVNVIHQMHIIYEINPKGGVLRFNSLLFEMLFLLDHYFSREIPELAMKKDIKNFNRLEPVLTYSTEHYAESVSLAEIAGIACFQEDYFCHFFKKIWE